MEQGPYSYKVFGYTLGHQDIDALETALNEQGNEGYRVIAATMASANGAIIVMERTGV